MKNNVPEMPLYPADWQGSADTNTFSEDLPQQPLDVGGWPVRDDVAPRRGWRKLQHIIYEETWQFRPRMALLNLLLAPLPIYVGARLRVRMLRLFGFKGIAPGSVMWGLPTINGRGDIYRMLTIGHLCRMNVGCFLELGAAITIGELVAIGPQVMILTTTHEIGTTKRRSSYFHSLPVTVGDGVWLGARSTILPGVTIGEGAIVAAGALVNKDVPPNTLVAGVPARVVKQLP